MTGRLVRLSRAAGGNGSLTRKHYISTPVHEISTNYFPFGPVPNDQKFKCELTFWSK